MFYLSIIRPKLVVVNNLTKPCISIFRLNSTLNESDFDAVKKRGTSKTRNHIPPPIDLKSIRANDSDKSKYEGDSKAGFSLVALALFSIPVLTFGLGVWQVKRREWKISIIDFLNSRTKSEPRELPNDPAELENLVETSEYCPFKLKGYFLHSKEILIAPRSDLTQSVNLPGANVVTPFVLTNGPKLTVLVNRGYVPYMKYSPVTRQEGQVEGEVEFVGLLRSNEIINSFTPENKPEKNEWHYRSVNQMASFLGTVPIFLDAVESSSIKGGPIGGQTAINIRNEHMSYIVTWFSLSFLTTLLWFKKFIRF